VRAAEPATLTAELSSPGLEKALHALCSALSTPQDEQLSQALRAKTLERIDQKNEAYHKLLPDLLHAANLSQTHWRYKGTFGV